MKSIKRSNTAHQRLIKVNKERYSKTKKEKYQQRSLYHGLVKNLQLRDKEVFDESEKKKE